MSRNYRSEIICTSSGTRRIAHHCTPKIEAEVHHYLKGRCIKTTGVFAHQIGGIDNHVHLCLTIPPTLLISEFIGQLKGSSSHEINQKFGSKVVEWQTGYSVVSFGTANLPWVKDYVRNQRDHRARGNTVDRLERITEREKAEAE